MLTRIVKQTVSTNIQRRFYSHGFPSKPHFGLITVPEGHRYVIETLGKYTNTLNPGIHFLVPVIQTIAHDVDIRVKCIEIEREDAYTADNVQVTLSGNLYIKFDDPKKACYNVNRAIHSAVQLAMSTARTSIGKYELNTVVESRSVINANVTESMREVVEEWGAFVTGFEITHLDVKDEKVKDSLSEQSSAERRRRATELGAMGEKKKTELTADAELYRRKAAAEAYRIEMEQKGLGEKQFALLKAEGEAEAIQRVGEAMDKHGLDAAKVRLASERIEAFSNIAKNNSLVVVPENISSLTGLLTSATSIFSKSLDNKVNDSERN